MKITRKQLKQIIKEALLVEKNENPSWNLYKYTGDVWTKFSTNVSGPKSKIANEIREIYVSLSSIALQFASVYAKVEISSQDIYRNISDIKSRLDKLKVYSQEPGDQIAVLTGDDAFDVSKMKFATKASDIAAANTPDADSSLAKPDTVNQDK